MNIKNYISYIKNKFISKIIKQTTPSFSGLSNVMLVLHFKYHFNISIESITTKQIEKLLIDLEHSNLNLKINLKKDSKINNNIMTDLYYFLLKTNKTIEAEYMKEYKCLNNFKPYITVPKKLTLAEKLNFLKFNSIGFKVDEDIKKEIYSEANKKGLLNKEEVMLFNILRF
jgi:hypothetical protein